MKKRLAIIAGTLAMTVGMVIGGTGAAFASSSPHTSPGVPGTPSCVGQTTAFVAQMGTPPGIGNVPLPPGLSVQQLKQIIDAYCTSAP